LVEAFLIMSTLAIVEAFRELPHLRRGAERCHDQALCLSLFTLAVSAGCRGFLAISDWLNSYRAELLELFSPLKNRLPSYTRDTSGLAEIGLRSIQSVSSQVL